MRIALISTPFITTPPVGYGGLERVVWDLARGLIDLGQKVVIVGAEGSKTPDGGYTIEAMPCAKNANEDWLKQEKRMWNVWSPLIDSADFDIIHGHNWFGFEYASKTRNENLNVCHTHHGWLNTRWWQTTKPDFPLNLMAISDWMATSYAAIGFSARRVYNGVDLTEYPYSKDHGDRLLYVGRLADYKQPHIAIKVAQELDMPLDIVGGTFVNNIGYMNSIIAKAEDDPNIELYLDADHSTKVELMQNAKAVLFPSAMGEPFGLVIIEGFSCGAPVIALDDGAVKEIITDKTGIVCKARDDKEAVSLMVQAVRDLDLSPADCRKRAELFSKEAMAQNYLDAYTDILNGNEW